MRTNDPNTPVMGLHRSRRDRVLGGVCAWIAQGIGVDLVLVRIAAVLMVFGSTRTAVVYLLGWVLLSLAAESPARSGRCSGELPAGSAKAAWTAAGDELRSLAAHMRGPTRRGEGSERPSLRFLDAAMTALGARLRGPELREGARRALAGLSAAVDASAVELGDRARRGW